MTKRYIIDKEDIHDLLAGKELSLSQGRERAFRITISENMTNGDMLKAVFPDVNFDYKIWWDNLYFKDTDWFYEPYEQKESQEV